MSFVRTAATAVALLSAGLLASATVAVAAPAAPAGEPPPQGGATATLEGLKTYGQAVVRQDGEELTTGAGLFEMAVDGGGALQTYGIDVDNPTQQQARYGETDWDQTSLHDNPDAGRILWILRHSYPQVNDLEALAKSSGAGKLSPQTAAAGTQVAIWRYSEGVGGEGEVEVGALDPAAEKLADHLQRKARTMTEPRASLFLERAEVSGRPGERLGPVTVRTGAPGVAVAPATGSGPQGVRVVDGDGRPLTEAKDGGRLYFEVPEEGGGSGAASLTVQAATKVAVGRAFTGLGGHGRSQAQILAGSSQSTVSATTTVSWARHGAIPAVTAEKDCAAGGLTVTVTSAGKRGSRFRLAGEEHWVGAGGTRAVTVPVGEDQAYSVPVTGPGGLRKTFTGVLDCATRSAVDSRESEGMSPQSHPATAGGGEEAPDAVDSGGDLAETGTSNTPLILGTAVALVLIGAVAVLAVRRGRPGQAAEGGQSGEPGDSGAREG